MRRGVAQRIACRALPAALAAVLSALCGVVALGALAPLEGATAGASTKTATAPSTNVLDGHSYSLVTTRGGLIGFGAAISASGQTNPASPFVGGAPTPDGKGAWLAAADGAVETLGDAAPFGSMAGHALARPIVGIAATPTGGGYWLVAGDGGVFTFGDARFFGSTGAMHLNAPVVGMAATPTGGGYWLVAKDGGIFTFGDARFFGSTGAEHLVQPIVGMAATPTGGGYWLTAADGGVFTFGDAPFFGSAARFGRTVVGIAMELGGYQDPLRAVSGLTPERVDQGVDYAGSGPIYAVGDGVVLNTTNAGWPGGAFITYQLVDGPAAGDIVYVAENVVPRVTIGQEVNSDTVVGTLVDAYPNLETGWADPPGGGESMARAMGQWSTTADVQSLPTAFGENFSQLLTMLGAPPGLTMGPVQGTLPPGWPTWLPRA